MIAEMLGKVTSLILLVHQNPSEIIENFDKERLINHSIVSDIILLGS